MSNLIFLRAQTIHREGLTRGVTFVPTPGGLLQPGASGYMILPVTHDGFLGAFELGRDYVFDLNEEETHYFRRRGEIK
jgi:hypothetical protein